MKKKRHSTEQIMAKLREVEVGLAKGESVALVCRRLEITEQTYYRWRKEYGGLKIEQAKRFRELEKENTRLRRLVAEQALDLSILREASRGNS
jgi:putative transposase